MGDFEKSARRSSAQRTAKVSQPKPPDLDRNVKKLHKLFGVSHTIQKQTTTRRVSVTDQEREEMERKRIQALKEGRQQRISSLGANHRFVLEIVADLNNTDTEEIVMGVVDDPEYVELLNSVMTKGGSRACMLSYAQMEGYPTESGRYVEAMKRQKVRRTILKPIEKVELYGKWVVVYRNNNNKNVENRTVAEDVAMFCFNAEKKDQCLLVIKNFMDRVLLKSIETVSEFGVAELEQRRKFFHTMDMFNIFLKSSEATVSSMVNFEVSHELFKGLLLVRFQIEASSKDVKRVRLVERYFGQWMRQIQSILVEGKQIQRDGPDVGPLQMLVNWRKLLARYTSVKEFVSSRAFNNHKSCLILSRSSKLLKVDCQLTEYKQSTSIDIFNVIVFVSL